jgi:8-oxo-dGTP diphosphatase
MSAHDALERPGERLESPLCAVAVDLVILSVRDGALSILLGRRGQEPFVGQWALPGEMVGARESLDVAARRGLAEGAGVADLPVHLEQLGTYGDPERDPRMRVVSVAYLTLAPASAVSAVRGAAPHAVWLPVDRVQSRLRLAFDHARILADGVERARAKLEYSSVAAALCPEEFTVGELRRVYEAVWGVALDPRNFHRKITGTPDFLVPIGVTTSRQGGRPAQLFRRGKAVLLNPPMLRPEA